MNVTLAPHRAGQLVELHRFALVALGGGHTPSTVVGAFCAFYALRHLVTLAGVLTTAAVAALGLVALYVVTFGAVRPKVNKRLLNKAIVTRLAGPTVARWVR